MYIFMWILCMYIFKQESPKQFNGQKLRKEQYTIYLFYTLYYIIIIQFIVPLSHSKLNSPDVFLLDIKNVNIWKSFQIPNSLSLSTASITYRNTANFTPRPGRSLSDEDDYSGSRSPPFAPRLGRQDHSALWRITPRPGRQDPRIKRSVPQNSTDSQLIGD